MLDKGFPPAAVRWVRAFLTARKGKVRVGDMVSAAREFSEGFPQGTVLGPILWDLYVDELIPELRAALPAGTKAEVVVYADDVTVVLRARDLATLCRHGQKVVNRLSR